MPTQKYYTFIDLKGKFQFFKTAVLSQDLVDVKLVQNPILSFNSIYT
jgi:hypothetical protein